MAQNLLLAAAGARSRRRPARRLLRPRGRRVPRCRRDLRSLALPRATRASRRHEGRRAVATGAWIAVAVGASLVAPSYRAARPDRSRRSRRRARARLPRGRRRLPPPRPSTDRGVRLLRAVPKAPAGAKRRAHREVGRGGGDLARARSRRPAPPARPARCARLELGVLCRRACGTARVGAPWVAPRDRLALRHGVPRHGSHRRRDGGARDLQRPGRRRRDSRADMSAFGH